MSRSIALSWGVAFMRAVAVMLGCVETAMVVKMGDVCCGDRYRVMRWRRYAAVRRDKMYVREIEQVEADAGAKGVRVRRVPL
jgi:hypothetical protein